MARARLGWRFLLLNVGVWLAMVVILVVVPDQLEQWMPQPVARVLGWAVAGSVWVVAVEVQWQRRLSALGRFGLQLLLWVSAALLAMWISDQFRVD